MDIRLNFGEHLKIATAKDIQCGENFAQFMPNIGGPREAKRRLVVRRRRLVEKWEMRWHCEQTRRWTYRLIPELATWLNREHGEVGFYLEQALSGHSCFNAYLRRFKKRDEEMCCYCDFPVDNADHALFVCAKWGVAREALGQTVGTELTPDTMVFLMLQSERNWTLIESFVTLVMKTRELDGRRERNNGEGQ